MWYTLTHPRPVHPERNKSLKQCCRAELCPGGCLLQNYVLVNPPCEQWESLDFTKCSDLVWGCRNVDGKLSRGLIICKRNKIWVVSSKKVRDTNGIKIINEIFALSIPTVWNQLCEINEVQPEARILCDQGTVLHPNAYSLKRQHKSWLFLIPETWLCNTGHLVYFLLSI